MNLNHPVSPNVPRLPRDPSDPDGHRFGTDDGGPISRDWRRAVLRMLALLLLAAVAAFVVARLAGAESWIPISLP